LISFLVGCVGMCWEITPSANARLGVAGFRSEHTSFQEADCDGIVTKESFVTHKRS